MKEEEQIKGISKEKTNSISDRSVTVAIGIVALILIWIHIKINISFIEHSLVIIISILLAFFAYGFTKSSISNKVDDKIIDGFAVVSLIAMLSMPFFYYGSNNTGMTNKVLMFIGFSFIILSFVGWLVEKNRLEAKNINSSIGLLTPYILVLLGTLTIFQDFILYQLLVGLIVLFSVDLTIDNTNIENDGKYKNFLKPKFYVKFVLLAIFFFIFINNYEYFITDEQFISSYLSIIIQVLATIVTILIAFVTILGPNIKRNNNLVNFFEGLKGFSVYYLLILVFSIMLFTINFEINDVSQLLNLFGSKLVFNWDKIQSLLFFTLFEIIFLSFPLGLIYLHSLVRDYLNINIRG